MVETEDFTLLHGTNIYSNSILVKAKKEGIKFKITHQLIPSPSIEKFPKEYFKPLLDIIKEKTQGKGLMKKLNNIISGYLGKTENTTYTAQLDCDEEEVIRHIWDTDLYSGEAAEEGISRLFEDPYENINYRDDILLQYLYVDGKKILLYGGEQKKKLHEHALPIYIQILDKSNIMLYDMAKEVGGEVIYRHTDCIVCLGGKVPTERLTKNWGDYSIKDDDFHWKSIMKTEERMCVFEIQKNIWKDNIQFSSSNHWKEIIAYAKEKGGLEIIGRAGTGKSHIIKEGLKQGILTNCLTTSFTNKASLNINGTTIHKLLNLSSDYKIPSKTLNKFKNIEVIVVDEIGMINNKLWNCLMILKKSHPHIVWILMGDYRQLEPIDEDRLTDWNIFNHPVVKDLCNNNRIELTEKQRYDQDLWDCLEDGYERGDWSKIARGTVGVEEIAINKAICFKNSTRKEINKVCMNYLKNQTETFFLPTKTEEEVSLMTEIEKEEYEHAYNQDAWIYVGLPVMSIVNNNKLEIVNGEEFVISNYDDDFIYIARENNEIIPIRIEDFHSYLIVSYCSTAHKSQGATYKNKVLIFDWELICKNNKLAYTSCSRATKLENILIVAF